MIAVLIPTLGRPENIRRVIDDLEPTAPRNLIDPIFIVEEHDTATREAIEAIQRTYIVNRRSPSYAGAINTAVEATTHDHLFIASDDLHFHDGWHLPLLELARTHGLVGTNDLHNHDVLAGQHATHYMVTRAYADRGTIDGTEPLLHEGYAHNYCDTEAVATAKHRGQFRPCLDSIVEHLHYVWGLASIDETYAKGVRSLHEDAALFANRSHLWT
jgi:glycosyltransferase involved in cell wall biosynthesis